MSRGARIGGIAALLVGVGWSQPSAPSVDLPTQVRDDAAAASLNPTVEVTGGSIEQERRLRRGVDEFLHLGLALPDLEILFTADTEQCHGHLGLFDPRFKPPRITICADFGFVYEHELAHAWAHANLTHAIRERFMDLRGHSNWADPGMPWGLRGTEGRCFCRPAEAPRPTPSVFAE